MGVLFFFCSTAICAQHFSYFYRLVVVMFADNDQAIRNFNRPLSKLVGLALLFVVSGVIGFSAYNIAMDYEDFRILAATVPPLGNPYWCVHTKGLRPLWISLMGVIFLLSQVLNLAGGILNIRMIRSAKQKLSPATYKMHLQLTVLLLIQGLLPILFVLSPFGALLLWVTNPRVSGAEFMPWYYTGNTSFRYTQMLMQLSLLLLDMFPMTNAILIIVFIKPYRKIFVQLCQRLIPKILKRRSNAVEDAPQPARIEETFSQTRDRLVLQQQR
ncbi:hypothetical protein DdX_16626 [Ditylenchus destructor]|uniref:Uncharacterized protein n=1 Tax=Ditylenchus destructor TaxID=166010 RepID=A0AAD4MNP2_9BILA|nr:hypothetical protein DdX_16626 [Ditylenchus destructor]